MKKKIDVYGVFLHVALVGLCVVVMLLAKENQRLRDMAADGGAAEVTGPTIGQTVEPVTWQPLEGEPEVLDFAAGDRESFLFVFTTTCAACRENQDAWRDLHRDLGDSVDVLGVSLSDLQDTRAYRETHELSFPVGVPTKPEVFAGDLAISAVPMTIRVGADGKVSGSWSGVLSPDRLRELARSERG